VFGRGYCYNDQELESLLEDNALLDYAAHYWGHHACGHAEETCKGMVLDFLHDNAKVASASQVLLVDSRFQFLRYSQMFPKDFLGMHMASFFGLQQTINSELEKGAKPDWKDSNGRTPLSWGAQNGHEAVVRMLLAQDDVDVDLKDNNGRTPLSWATENRHEAVVRLLLEQDDVDVNSKDINGRTPLLWAAENGHEAVVRLLLTQDDVDVNSKDINHWTALSLAVQNKHEMVVRLLLAQDNVDANSQDMNGQTLLSWASDNGHEAVVRLLLARGDVDANSRDSNSWTPLLWAVENKHEAVVRLLLMQDNVDVNSKASNGQTPLSLAVDNGHEAVVRLLLAHNDICHDQTFSHDHSHDPRSRDPSPDERLAIKNLISSHKLYCPSKVRLETLSRFRLYIQHTFPPIMPMAGRSVSNRSLSFLFMTLSVLLCFIVVISRTKTTIEYPSINLVLYSYTPNEELDSWQIVLAQLTSFLEP